VRSVKAGFGFLFFPVYAEKPGKWRKQARIKGITGDRFQSQS
jgi:hypothetical protein